jgi:transposase
MTALEIQLTEELKREKSKLREAHQRIELLEQKVDLLIRRVFGKSSEAIDPGQLDLFLKGPQAPVPVAVKAEPLPTLERAQPKTRTPRAERVPENLPVITEVIDPEPVKTAPEKYRFIGQEVTERLDYRPGQFLRRQTIRRKYVNRLEVDLPPVMAELPPSLQERGMAAPGLLAHVIVSKYCDHLPLYRQEQIYKHRHGVFLPRQTLARWMELAADWLRFIYEEIKAGVLAGGYVQLDESPIKYLAPGHGKTKLGFIWVGSKPAGDVFFQWETSRSAECLEKLITIDFKGVVQCDGYKAYPAFIKQHKESITQAGCWAHARRYFFEAQEHAPRTASWILRQLQNLYAVERELRENKAGPKLRAAERAHKSRPIVDRIQKAVMRLQGTGRYLPKSSMGKAFGYLQGQWSMLQVYLQDGRVEIDNNLVENAIRPTALGKKNWLFVGEAEAGERSAILYTLVESCRRRGIDPYTYLQDVLTQLPYTNRQDHKLTPAAWQTDQIKKLKTAS